jgi:hypothetical protein
MALPAELAATDRILQRWAVSIGDGSFEGWADVLTARPPPLPEDLAVDVDQAIMRAPTWIRRLLKDWYKANRPADYSAQWLGPMMGLGGMSRQAVYPYHRQALWYMRGVFESRGILQRHARRATATVIPGSPSLA